MKLLLSAVALCGALALAGCDAATGPDLSAAATADARGGKDAPNADAAVYEARLRPLNADENGAGVTGVATFTVEGDLLTATVDARNLAVDPPLGIHPQHIHAGPECPTMADDANGDGVLDVVEGSDDYGSIFVWLAQEPEGPSASPSANFPSATSVRGRPGYGPVDYSADTALGALVDGLREPLALENRTVVLHAVSDDTDLPESVQSFNGLPAKLTLPVACGEIRRVR